MFSTAVPSKDVLVVVFLVAIIWHKASNVVGKYKLGCMCLLRSHNMISRYWSVTFSVSSHYHLELLTSRAAGCSFSVLIIMQIFDYLLREITASSFTNAACLSPVIHIKGKFKLSMWSVNHPVMHTVCSGCVSELMMGSGCVFVMHLRL